MTAMSSTSAMLLMGVCLGAAALAFLLWVLMTRTAADASGDGDDTAGEPAPAEQADRTGGGSEPSTAGTDG